MKYSKIISILLIFYSYSCDSVSNNDQESTTVTLPKKEWVNSYEEETDDTKIFRPADYKNFPASHYRHVFIFEDNNKCKYSVIGDTDIPHYKDGIWELKNNDQLIVITDSVDHIKYQLEIVELKEDLLKCIYVY